MNMELKMMVIVCFFLVISCTGHLTYENDVDDGIADANLSLLPEGTNKITEKATQKIEELALIAKKTSKIGLLEDLDVYYKEMAHILDDIIADVTDSTHAYTFLKAKGLKRVVSPNLGIDHAELRTKLLGLLKTLFEVAPVTTNALIPNGIVIKLIDIFEKDDSLPLKAQVLEILQKWLPNNPIIQTRVMKDRGLTPFFVHIKKLDTPVMQSLLELLNTVLKEHVLERSEKAEVTKLDYDRRILYEKIGLLERIESSVMCSGMVDIFQGLWANDINTEGVKTVLELIRSTKPFCGNILKGNTKALAFLEDLLEFVKKDQKYFENIGLNATEFESVIEDYIGEVIINKDEL